MEIQDIRGLCLVPVTQGQHGPLPRPALQAQPSALVPLDTPVTLRCRGPPGVDLYRLEQLGTKEYSNQDALIIPAMSRASAGRYRCSYQNGSRWSPPSEHLELVATGVFAKPLLTAIPSPAVSLGGDVTLQCQTQYGFDRFALYKEGQAGLQKRPGKWYQANFPIVTVTATHSGTYRCYSFSSASPHLWSAPSNPLELTVTGIPVATRQSPAEPPPSTTGIPVATRQSPAGPPPSTTEPSRNSSVRPEGAGSPAGEWRPLPCRSWVKPLPGGAELGGKLETARGPGEEPTSPEAQLIAGVRRPLQPGGGPPGDRGPSGRSSHLLPPPLSVALDGARPSYAHGNLVRLGLGALLLLLLAALLVEAWHSRRRARRPRGRALLRPLPPLPSAS
ncbi:platelet glycoprotein VI [Lepus europaeus]|uniref:platelet glycoprotein VI n=1 Tax=Lepus europaeus TaxID=9983 RepID=UPI002B489943|nr:platelet glycoprotein VI [Lepus europaeus]